MYLHFVINGQYMQVPSFFCSDAGTRIARPLLRRLRAACLSVAEPLEQPFGGQQGGIPILRHYSVIGFYELMRMFLVSLMHFLR